MSTHTRKMVIGDVPAVRDLLRQNGVHLNGQLEASARNPLSVCRVAVTDRLIGAVIGGSYVSRGDISHVVLDNPRDKALARLLVSEAVQTFDELGTPRTHMPLEGWLEITDVLAELGYQAPPGELFMERRSGAPMPSERTGTRDYVIRPMRESDLHQALLVLGQEPTVALCELETADFYRAAVHPDEDRPLTYLVAVEGDQVLGALVGGTHFPRGAISHVAVRGNKRGQGIGDALVRAALEKIERLGTPVTHVMLTADNIPVREFWERYSFAAQPGRTFVERDHPRLRSNAA